MAARAIFLEPCTLFGRVGQFDEGVGQFHAAEEEFEALGDARIARIAPREGRLRCGPVCQEGRVGAADMRLDPFEEQAEEQIFPGFGGRSVTRAEAARAGALFAVPSRSAPA